MCQGLRMSHVHEAIDTSLSGFKTTSCGSFSSRKPSCQLEHDDLGDGRKSSTDDCCLLWRKDNGSCCFEHDSCFEEGQADETRGKWVPWGLTVSYSFESRRYFCSPSSFIKFHFWPFDYYEIRFWISFASSLVHQKAPGHWKNTFFYFLFRLYNFHVFFLYLRSIFKQVFFIFSPYLVEIFLVFYLCHFFFIIETFFL